MRLVHQNFDNDEVLSENLMNDQKATINCFDLPSFFLKEYLTSNLFKVISLEVFKLKQSLSNQQRLPKIFKCLYF